MSSALLVGYYACTAVLLVRDPLTRSILWESARVAVVVAVGTVARGVGALVNVAKGSLGGDPPSSFSAEARRENERDPDDSIVERSALA